MSLSSQQQSRSAGSVNGVESTKRPNSIVGNTGIAGSPLLLNKANLAWTQPTGAFLAAPAPPRPPPAPKVEAAPLVQPPLPVMSQSLPAVTPYSTALPTINQTQSQSAVASQAPPTSLYSPTPYNSPVQPLPPYSQASTDAKAPPFSGDYVATSSAQNYPTYDPNYYTTTAANSYYLAYTSEYQTMAPSYSTSSAAMTTTSEPDYTKAFESLTTNHQTGQSLTTEQESTEQNTNSRWWTFYPYSTTSPQSEAALYQNFYVPVQSHWFYEKNSEGSIVYKPFSLIDSTRLEEAYQRQTSGGEAVVSVCGGRYDVDVNQRLRHAIYWEEKPSYVRRCTWFFYREGQQRPDPYDETFAAYLEEKYREACTIGKWNQKIELGSGNNNEYIVFYNTQTMMHFTYQPVIDEWTGVSENPMKGQVVRRGPQDFEMDLEEGEPAQIDHLIFMVHGVGPMCDFRMRSIVEVVDDLRSLSLRLTLQHFKNDQGSVGRIEFLPVSWHDALHGDETGIDSRLGSITLSSIPKLRAFSNDTILDALFYTSPVYSQTIVDAVGNELNRLYSLFLSRNNYFSGKVSLAGHSLGSLIIFDILSHQSSNNSKCPNVQLDPHSLSDVMSELNLDKSLAEAKDIEELCQMLEITELLPTLQHERIDLQSFWTLTENDLKELSLPLGVRKKILSAQRTLRKTNSIENDPTSPEDSSVDLFSYCIPRKGTGLPTVHYPKLNFETSCFFALGSPIAMFLTVRGVKSLEQSFSLPCSTFLNIFHPLDPIAYRIEPLINSAFSEHKPVLIPHHKGRKRMHLELKENLADFKQKVFESLKTAWGSISDYARGNRTTYPAITSLTPLTSPPTEKDINAEVEKVVNEELRRESEPEYIQEPDQAQVDLPIGMLNSGRRIDYVLQERPYEVFNEYLFAIAAHACYWESEDTALLLIKEMFCSQGIQPSSNNAVTR